MSVLFTICTDGQATIANAQSQASVRVKGGTQTGIVSVVATALQAQGEALHQSPFPVVAH